MGWVEFCLACFRLEVEAIGIRGVDDTFAKQLHLECKVDVVVVAGELCAEPTHFNKNFPRGKCACCNDARNLTGNGEHVVCPCAIRGETSVCVVGHRIKKVSGTLDEAIFIEKLRTHKTHGVVGEIAQQRIDEVRITGLGVVVQQK